MKLGGAISDKGYVAVQADKETIDVLYNCGLGTEERRSQRKMKRGITGSASCSQPKSVRITLEEAFCLQATIKCLEVSPVLDPFNRKEALQWHANPRASSFCRFGGEHARFSPSSRPKFQEHQ
jgi:hypothetical protein